MTGIWRSPAKQKDGSDKDYYHTSPRDVFVVNEHGWLIKIEKEKSNCMNIVELINYYGFPIVAVFFYLLYILLFTITL